MNRQKQQMTQFKRIGMGKYERKVIKKISVELAVLSLEGTKEELRGWMMRLRDRKGNTTLNLQM